MKRELEFHDYAKEKEKVNDFAMIMIFAEVVLIAFCIMAGFDDFQDADVAKYNEATMQFNALDLEQRRMFGEVLFGTEDRRPNRFDSETWTFREKEFKTFAGAVQLTFVALFGVSWILFAIYVLYCWLYRFYLADFPFKGWRSVLMLIFLPAGWLFFVMSYLRMRRTKAKLVHREN